MIAAIYVRISRDREGEALGVARQEKDCRALAEKRGWEVGPIFSDNDMSATNTKKPRPAWRELLKALDAGEFGAVVAYSSSRLYRRMADLGELIDLVEARKVKVATVASGDIDLSTADGRMLANILASVDAGEAERTRERVVRKMQEIRDAGRFTGGGRPFGLTADATAVVPEEAALIRDAAARLLAGESIRSILKEWEANGVRSTQGNVIRSRAFTNMMKSPRLAGLVSSTGQRAQWPAIISQTIHRQLVAMFAEPNRMRSRRPKGERYLLTGLVWCGICNGRLSGSPQLGRRYICRASGVVHLSVAADSLELFVVDQASDRTPVHHQVLDPGAVSGPILAALDAVEGKLANWYRESAEAGLRAIDIKAGAAGMLAEKESLEAELATAQPVKRTMWQEFADAAREDPRLWLESVIEKIVVLPAAKPSRIFRTERVQISWRVPADKTGA